LTADPYQTLGVKRDISQEEIQKAYRRLAKKLHPDLNPGNKKAEEEFKNVSVAYDLLGDPDKRARFDRGEIDASGAERPQHRYYRDFAEAGASHPYATDAGFADFAGADDVLSEIFGRGGRANLRMRGQDVHYRLELDFLDAVNGAKRQLTLPDKSALDVTIPARHGRRRVLPATAGDWHGVPRLVRAPYRGLRCIYGSDALEECRGAAKMSTRRRRVRRRSAPPACTPRTPSKSWRVNGAKIRRIAGLVNS
jgi:DnaJ-class molecular chaperone